ncbi:MAG TPA: carboxypeptidase-like regulatory domain-containing protein, partial [Puia sp.]|nr:carboxypeptidase-like regulatory domain-containing protein [Puia sp.]
MKKMRLLATVALAAPLAALLLFAVPLSAQSPTAHRVTGKVTTQSNGAAVAGATVAVKGTKNAVQADDNGDYSIMAAPGEHLIISYVGYSAKDIKLGTATVVNISLAQDASTMNDVVVVGYGKMKKSDLSAAVGTISSSDLQKTINVTLDDAIQGKAANVYVSQ